MSGIDEAEELEEVLITDLGLEEEPDPTFDLTLNHQRGSTLLSLHWDIYGVGQTKHGTQVRLERAQVSEYNRQQRVALETGFNVCKSVRLLSEDEEEASPFAKYQERMINDELHPRDFERPRKSLGFSFRVTL